MSNVKNATADHPILPLLIERYSPYVFDRRPVEPDKLAACLEAARWSASSYNEQPWFFMVAERENALEFEKMLGCLVEANQAWAKNAGALMITAICPHFTRNGKPNRVAEHDLGLAMGNFTVQATSLGLAVHQMAGINLHKARQEYQIPETHQPLTGVAIGYAGDPAQGDDANLAQRDQSPRTRKELSEFVFRGQWGKSS